MYTFYVYRYENKIDGKLYFGKGSKKRWRAHISYANGSRNTTSLLVNAIRNDGISAFNIDIMFDGLTEHEAFKLERKMIAIYHTNVNREYEPSIFGYGYNQADGGEGWSGHAHTVATKAKMSNTRKGKPTPMQGRPAWNKGKTATHSARTNMRLAHLGKPSNRKGCIQGSSPFKGKKRPEISHALKGKLKTTHEVQ